MPRKITVEIEVYSVDEARERLAKLVNHRKRSYSRGGFYRIVREHKPELTETRITEADLRFLADKLKKPGRPKTIDKSE